MKMQEALFNALYPRGVTMLTNAELRQCRNVWRIGRQVLFAEFPISGSEADNWCRYPSMIPKGVRYYLMETEQQAKELEKILK